VDTATTRVHRRMNRATVRGSKTTTWSAPECRARSTGFDTRSPAGAVPGTAVHDRRQPSAPRLDTSVSIIIHPPGNRRQRHLDEGSPRGRPLSVEAPVNHRHPGFAGHFDHLEDGRAAGVRVHAHVVNGTLWIDRLKCDHEMLDTPQVTATPRENTAWPALAHLELRRVPLVERWKPRLPRWVNVWMSTVMNGQAHRLGESLPFMRPGRYTSTSLVIGSRYGRRAAKHLHRFASAEAIETVIDRGVSVSIRREEATSATVVCHSGARGRGAPARLRRGPSVDSWQPRSVSPGLARHGSTWRCGTSGDELHAREPSRSIPLSCA